MPISPYVAHLRALVGTELLHMPSVATLCRDRVGRVLLVRQKDSGRWSTPGGLIEPGETPEAAAVREAKEETGLEVRLDRLRCALGGPDYRTVYSNGDELSYVAVVYDATVVGGKPTADGEETSEVGWFELAELDGMDKETFLTLLLRDGVLR
jgi:ADP-ribose pyrophosphatase YjhB (NUDIX family)